MGFSTTLFAGFVQPFCVAGKKRTVSSGILTVSLDLPYVKLRQMRSKLFLCHINKNGYAATAALKKRSDSMLQSIATTNIDLMRMYLGFLQP